MKFTHRLISLFTLLLILTGSLIFAETTSKNRDEIDAKYKWNFSDIYADWNEWEKGFNHLEQLMDSVAILKGTLSKGSKEFAYALKLQEKLDILSYKVYRYPQLMRDTDTRNQEVAANFQKVNILFSKFGTATAWINPEILTIPWETMKSWLDNEPDLKPYRFGLEDLYRQQAHVLDEEKEKLISYYSQFNGSPRETYSELSTSDIKFPTITLSTGEEFEITRGNYSKILVSNKNQEDRKLAFESHYQVFKDNLNTYAAIYNAVCQKDWANAQARNYGSSLEAALEGNNIPVTVYENLVNTVRKNTTPLQRYLKLRKKVLGLEKYYNFDGSINLIEFDKTYPYEEAQKYVLASVKPLGKDYQKKLEKALGAGWLDVFESPGKRPGAYSANVYGVHPYMLLNYNETLDYVFTLGHELGHTMHTLLASENQPFATHSYTIFVAEVASTFNENLLLDHLLDKAKDPKERIALIQQAISGITGTFFFQTLLADFELQVHTLVEKGQPVTAQVLNNIMHELFDAYYGDAVEKDDFIDAVWARIPHMYRTPFYVYQYATCYASSAQIYEEFTNGSKKERNMVKEKYLNLLKSGGNDYPMEQLKNAGVDLTKPETITAVINQMDKLVTLLEKEIDKLK